MSRDTQIGILVAAGFLGLVGYVGYQKWSPGPEGLVQRNATNPAEALPAVSSTATSESGGMPLGGNPAAPPSAGPSGWAADPPPVIGQNPKAPPELAANSGPPAPPTAPSGSAPTVPDLAAPGLPPTSAPAMPPTPEGKAETAMLPAPAPPGPPNLPGHPATVQALPEMNKEAAPESPSDRRDNPPAPPTLPAAPSSSPNSAMVSPAAGSSPTLPPTPPMETKPETKPDLPPELPTSVPSTPSAPAGTDQGPPAPPMVSPGERIEIPPAAGLRLKEAPVEPTMPPAPPAPPPAGISAPNSVMPPSGGGSTISPAPIASASSPPNRLEPTNPVPMVPATSSSIAPSHGQAPVRIREEPDANRRDGVLPIPIRGTIRDSGTQTVAAVESYDLTTITPRQGETYSTLSQQLYGSPRYARALEAYLRDYDPRLANLQPGRPLSLPPAEVLVRRFGDTLEELDQPEPLARSTTPRQVEPEPARANPRTLPRNEQPANPRREGDRAAGEVETGQDGQPRYRVRANDTLYAIAKRTLGSGDRWADIYNLNKDLLRGSVEVEPGMVLRLPANARVPEQR